MPPAAFAQRLHLTQAYILERDPQEAESSLKRYLEYEAVRSRQAIEAARRDYRNAARKRRVERTLPDAWTKLVESEDELLIELLSEKVEDLCGVRPAPDAVAAFLRGRALAQSEVPSAPALQKPRQSPQPATTSDVPQIIGHELYGQRRRARKARDVLIQVFREFVERFATLPKHGRKRRCLARTREELFPGSQHLVVNAHQLCPGWWCDPHASRAGIARRIRMACEVAGVRSGENLTVNL